MTRNNRADLGWAMALVALGWVLLLAAAVFLLMLLEVLVFALGFHRAARWLDEVMDELEGWIL